MLTFEQIKNNADINTYITQADKSLAALGYTEHSFAHVTKVASTSEYILSSLGASEDEIELAKIAAYMHDIGNIINRNDHSQSGAVMAFRILDKLNMSAENIAKIMAAIGNHDEGTGVPIDNLSAVLILADKSDVRRSRVRNQNKATFDIHDRVNYSVTNSQLVINEERTTITLSLTVDTAYGSIMEYFQIFMARMILCRTASEKLGLSFNLIINNQKIL